MLSKKMWKPKKPGPKTKTPPASHKEELLLGVSMRNRRKKNVPGHSMHGFEAKIPKDHPQINDLNVISERFKDTQISEKLAKQAHKIDAQLKIDKELREFVLPQLVAAQRDTYLDDENENEESAKLALDGALRLFEACADACAWHWGMTWRLAIIIARARPDYAAPHNAHHLPSIVEHVLNFQMICAKSSYALSKKLAEKP